MDSEQRKKLYEIGLTCEEINTILNKLNKLKSKLSEIKSLDLSDTDRSRAKTRFDKQVKMHLNYEKAHKKFADLVGEILNK